MFGKRLVLIAASIVALMAAGPSSSAMAMPASTLQTGYTFQACNAPSSGFAIRAGDNDGATALGRLFNGNVGRIYSTSASEPSISPGWATGYGRLTNGDVVHGYFKTAYTCRTS